MRKRRLLVAADIVDRSSKHDAGYGVYIGQFGGAGVQCR
jgi:hypothetical protein